MNPIILIAASAGGLDPIRQIVAALPIPCGASVFVVRHIGNLQSVLPDLLTEAAGLPATHAQDGSLIEAGHIYVAPPDHHMILEVGRIRLNRGPKIHFTRPAADPLFISAAEVYGARVVGIVLSGNGADAAVGLRTIKEHRGIALVQHPADARAPEMPRSAIMADHPDAVLSVAQIAQRVGDLCSRHAPLPIGRPESGRAGSSA